MAQRNDNTDATTQRERRRYAAICFLLMVGVAVFSYAWSGLSWWTLFAIAVALSCPIVVAIAWWQSERARRAVQRALAQLRDSRIKPGEKHGP